VNDATKVFIGIAVGVGLAAIGTLIYILASGGEGGGERDTERVVSVTINYRAGKEPDQKVDDLGNNVP